MAAENVLATQVTAGVVIAATVKYLKASPRFSWINEETTTITRLVTSLLAGLSAVGVHWVWNPQLHSLTITDLNAVAIIGAAWALAKQYAMQHLASKVMYPSSTNGTKVPQVPKM